MGATIFVVALAGLVLPITLILAAVLVDVAVLTWAAHRWWHDELAPLVWSYLTRHVGEPISRYAHAHPVQVRSR